MPTETESYHVNVSKDRMHQRGFDPISSQLCEASGILIVTVICTYRREIHKFISLHHTRWSTTTKRKWLKRTNLRNHFDYK